METTSSYPVDSMVGATPQGERPHGNLWSRLVQKVSVGASGPQGERAPREASKEVKVTARLTKVAYDALEKQVRGVLPVIPKTDGEAHAIAGVELVLRKLREGYVIGGWE